jgi:predicted neuraminidase
MPRRSRLWQAASLAMVTLGLWLEGLPARAGDPPAATAPAAVDPSLLPPGVVMAEFLFAEAPFAACHASTLASSGEALVAAWFAGSREGQADVGIWVARKQGEHWSAPVEVATGQSPDGQRYPCWNPVLFPLPSGLLLFYKVGPTPDTWWGMLLRSSDGGQTWSAAERLPEKILGPIKNKPELLPTGRLLCPSSEEQPGWTVHLEWTSDAGRHWERSSPLNDPAQIEAIQPTILRLGGDKLAILSRTRQGKIAQATSNDGGQTWSAMALLDLPNPNSGIDAITLADGRHLLVYNHVGKRADEWGGPRWPLNVAVSADLIRWQAAAVLETEPGEFSYPAVIQTGDGLVHVSYTWERRKIKHVVLDPTRLPLRAMPAGAWPPP